MDAGEKGVPDDRHFVRYIEQRFSNSVDAQVERAERWAKALLSGPARPDTRHPRPGWFANQILEELRFTRYYIDQKEAHRAVWYGLRLGELITAARCLGYLNGPEAPRGPIPPRADPPASP